MFGHLADHRNPRSMAFRLRKKRLELFFDMLRGLPEPVSVLDIGGVRQFWTSLAPELPVRCEITLLNLDVDPNAESAGFRSVAGDARKMEAFADGSFDVCFSNSVIEHVGTLSDQISMAKEVQRVGRYFFIQTPNRHFPIEPHFLFPLWQYLPAAVRAALLRRRSFGWMKQTSDPLKARAEVEQIRLLNHREMQALFPTATIYREKVGPLTKSLIALSRRD